MSELDLGTRGVAITTKTTLGTGKPSPDAGVIGEIPGTCSVIFHREDVDLEPVIDCLAKTFSTLVQARIGKLKGIALLPEFTPRGKPSIADWIEQEWLSPAKKLGPPRSRSDMAAACCYLIHRVAACSDEALFQVTWHLRSTHYDDNGQLTSREYDLDPITTLVDPEPAPSLDLSEPFDPRCCVVESRLSVSLPHAYLRTMEFLLATTAEPTVIRCEPWARRDLTVAQRFALYLSNYRAQGRTDHPTLAEVAKELCCANSALHATSAWQDFLVAQSRARGSNGGKKPKSFSDYMSPESTGEDEAKDEAEDEPD